jgi:hypothetical protein
MMTSDLDALLGRGAQVDPDGPVAAGRVGELAGRLGRKTPLHRDAVWPGGTLPIRVRVLTAGERHAATIAARKAVPDGAAVGAAPVDQGQFQLESVLQILVRAVLAIEGEPLFASAAELDATCTEDEINSLYQLYADVRRSADPAGVSEETIAELAEAATADDRVAFLEVAETLPRAALFRLLARVVTNLPPPAEPPPPAAEGD